MICSDFEIEIKNRWVVIIIDPDFGGDSPWSVIADTKEGAIEAALAEYDEWAESETPTPLDTDLVSRVYASSWIGRLA